MEKQVRAFLQNHGDRVYCGGDWTKLCAVFGEHAFTVEREGQQAGLYAEFCDGSVVNFYLSPATRKEDFEKLTAFLEEKFITYPLTESTNDCDTSPVILQTSGKTEWVNVDKATDCINARPCGLFPPCTPLLAVGERITMEKIALLKQADNVFGLRDGKIEVFKNE